jgi:hypothetical protein
MVYSKITFKLILEPRISVLRFYFKKSFLYLDVDGRIIRKWIFKNWGLEAWTGLVWLNKDRWQLLVDVVMEVRVP